jgi:hypothetical protein
MDRIDQRVIEESGAGTSLEGIVPSKQEVYLGTNRH